MGWLMAGHLKSKGYDVVVYNRAAAAVGEALRKYGVTDATIAGGHVTTARQADVAPSPGRDCPSVTVCYEQCRLAVTS
jgi:3-hydroxyisobutyrate dehydrogenase-like beta-hydroxyacid dehydrogenase